MEKYMSASNVKFCSDISPGKDCSRTKRNKNPHLHFPPKYKHPALPLLSSELYIFRSKIHFFASTVNQIQHGLRSVTLQRQRKPAPYNSKQSTRQEPLRKYGEAK